MDANENMIGLETYLYQLCRSQLESNDIPVPFQRLIMGSVYSRFLGAALDQMVLDRVEICRPDEKGERVTMSEDNIRELADELNSYYGRESNA